MGWTWVVCGSGGTCRRSAVVAALTLATLLLLVGAVLLAQTKYQGDVEQTADTVLRRQRRRAADEQPLVNRAVSTQASIPAPLTASLHGKTGDYVPLYRRIQVARATNEVDVQPTAGTSEDLTADTEDLSVDDEPSSRGVDYGASKDHDYDQSTDYYAAADDDEASTSVDGETADVSEETAGGGRGDGGANGSSSSSSSPSGKEFAGYYAAEAADELDDGQKFDDEEYETTFISPGMHYGDNVEIVEQLMVRNDDDDDDDLAVQTPSRPARRVSTTSGRGRRRHRGRQLPTTSRRHRSGLYLAGRRSRRRGSRRLIRVPAAGSRLSRLRRLSRDNIQIHPAVAAPRVRAVPRRRVLSYTPAVQYVAAAGYRLADGSSAASAAGPVIIHRPVSAASSALQNSRPLGLSSQRLQMVELASDNALDYHQAGSSYATAVSDGDELQLIPVTIRQSSLGVASSLPDADAAATGGDGGGGSLQYVMQPSGVQLVTAADGRMTLVPVQTVHRRPAPPATAPPPSSLRTLPEVRASSPTYIILKLSGTRDAGAAESAVPAERDVRFGNRKVKYIDLSELLSKGHRRPATSSVTSSPPTESRGRPPATSWQAPARPGPASWSRDPPPPAPPPPPPPVQPTRQRAAPTSSAQAPAFSHDRRPQNVHSTVAERRRGVYLPQAPPPSYHRQHQHHQYPYQQQQLQQQRALPSNEHQQHSSHVRQHQRRQVPSAAAPAAIQPLYAPTPV